MKWIKIKDKKQNCYEEGDWDGLRSEFVLVISDGDYSVARMYKGTMDGFEFADFFTKDDFEIKNVTEWCIIKYQ